MILRHGVAAFILAAGWLAGTSASSAELSPGELKRFRQAVRAHIQEQRAEEEDGAFVVRDEKLDKEWRLKFIGLRDEVSRMSEQAYSVCADFKEIGGKTRLDVDFLVNRSGSGWAVRQTAVHLVGGKPRVARAASAAPLRKAGAGEAVFICAMGDYSGPRTQDGKCPKCGMNLVEKK
jgi:hypothetical protein